MERLKVGDVIELSSNYATKFPDLYDKFLIVEEVYEEVSDYRVKVNDGNWYYAYMFKLRLAKSDKPKIFEHTVIVTVKVKTTCTLDDTMNGIRRSILRGLDSPPYIAAPKDVNISFGIK